MNVLTPVIALPVALFIWSSTGHAEITGLVRPSAQAVNADAKVMDEFRKRVEAYVALHRKVLSAITPLPENAKPEEIDEHQRMFGVRIAEARADARQGDLLTTDVQDVIRRLMTRLFATAESRQQLRASIMDDNPEGQIVLVVNKRYPDEIPLSTMPPSVLRNLPQIPKEVEYRFVGESLILLDPAAHIIADFMPNALPR